MTLEKFKKEKDYWRRERDYYSWASIQPSSNELHEEDLKKYKEAVKMCEKLQKIEDNILTEGLKSVII